MPMSAGWKIERWGGGREGDEGRDHSGGRIHKPATICLLFSGGGGRGGEGERGV
jgi:hypothetical protein